MITHGKTFKRYITSYRYSLSAIYIPRCLKNSPATRLAAAMTDPMFVEGVREIYLFEATSDLLCHQREYSPR